MAKYVIILNVFSFLKNILYIKYIKYLCKLKNILKIASYFNFSKTNLTEKWK